MMVEPRKKKPNFALSTTIFGTIGIELGPTWFTIHATKYWTISHAK